MSAQGAQAPATLCASQTADVMAPDRGDLNMPTVDLYACARFMAVSFPLLACLVLVVRVSPIDGPGTAGEWGYSSFGLIASSICAAVGFFQLVTTPVSRSMSKMM